MNPRTCLYLGAVAIAGLALGGCGGSDNNTTNAGTVPPVPTATDFTSFVTTTVNSSCSLAVPQSINATSFSFDETTVINVDTLTPCTL